MKEIRDILHAFSHANRAGKKTAIATFVHASGSLRRRLGVRVLITEDGQVFGSDSKGSIEGRAFQKVLGAITEQKNRLLVFNTSEKEDAKFCIPLGFSGVVQVLIEPILTFKLYNPIELLQQLAAGRKDAVLVTLFSPDQTVQQGTRLLYRTDMLQCTLPTTLQAQVLHAAQEALFSKSSGLNSYACGAGTCYAFVQFIPASAEMSVGGKQGEPFSGTRVLAG